MSRSLMRTAALAATTTLVLAGVGCADSARRTDTASDGVGRSTTMPSGSTSTSAGMTSSASPSPAQAAGVTSPTSPSTPPMTASRDSSTVADSGQPAGMQPTNRIGQTGTTPSTSTMPQGGSTGGTVGTTTGSDELPPRVDRH